MVLRGGCGGKDRYLDVVGVRGAVVGSVRRLLLGGEGGVGVARRLSGYRCVGCGWFHFGKMTDFQVERLRGVWDVVVDRCGGEWPVGGGGERWVLPVWDGRGVEVMPWDDELWREWRRELVDVRREGRRWRR